MNPQFRPLTRHEMFFGIAPKMNLSAGGTINSTALISKVATAPINEPFISPTPNISINSDVIAQQKLGFVLASFIMKYKWEIGLGIAVGVIIYCSMKKDEDRIDSARQLSVNE